MKVLHVCSELYPLLKTGGLADVMGALPFAQKEIGIDARILLPAYPAIAAGIPNTSVVAEWDNFAGHIVLRYGEYHGVGVYLIDDRTCMDGKVIRIMMAITMIMAITINVLHY